MRMMLVYITYIINLISRQSCVSKWSFRGRSLLSSVFGSLPCALAHGKPTVSVVYIALGGASVCMPFWFLCGCLHIYIALKSWSLIVGTLVAIRPAPLLLDQPNTSSSSLHWPKESMNNIYNRFSISCLLCHIYYFGCPDQLQSGYIGEHICIWNGN